LIYAIRCTAVEHQLARRLHASECKTCLDEIKPPTAKFSWSAAAQFAYVESIIDDAISSFFHQGLLECYLPESIAFALSVCICSKQNRRLCEKTFSGVEKHVQSFPTPPPSVAPVRRNFRLIRRRYRPGKFNFLPSKALSKRPLCSVPLKNNGDVV
jgi:hypothetical protein